MILLSCMLFLGCRTVPEKNELPQTGYYCYQSSDEKNTYLKLVFSGDKIEGQFLLEDEYYGNVFYSFNGVLSKDSVLNVDIWLPQDVISQEWYIRVSETGITLHSELFEHLTDFRTVDCNKLPDLDDYISIADIDEEWDDEYDVHSDPDLEEYNQPYYYELKSNAGAYKRITTHEYVQLWIDSGRVYGRGAGASEGEPEWTFHFSGKKVAEEKFDITVNYTQGENQFSLDETWDFDESEGEIVILKNGDKRPGGSRLRKVSPVFIPDPMITLFSSEKLEDE